MSLILEKFISKGGVHVQERGNASLPVDIVKVLKTQDENYLRTMRTAGLKVFLCNNQSRATLTYAALQKIDKLKNQLSELADLFKFGENEDAEGEDELGENELQILREAGVIATPSTKRKRKSFGSRKPKHLVFVDTLEQGMLSVCYQVIHAIFDVPFSQETC